MGHRAITFKIDDDLLERLDLYAIKKKSYRSEIIREAIVEYLKAHDEPVGPVKVEKQRL